MKSGLRLTGLAVRCFARALAFAAATATALLAGCDQVPDVVKIGVAQPLSTALGPLGQDMVNGAQMAVDEINAAGGVNIHGKHARLALVIADDKGANDAGDLAAQTLVSQGVVAAIADLNSGVSIHTAPIYASATIPQMAISTKAEFTKLGLPTTLRLVASDDLQSKALATFAMQLPGTTHFAVVDDGTPYGKGLADLAAKLMGNDGKRVEVRESLDDKTTDFTALVAGLSVAHTEVMVTTLSDFQVAALMAQLARAGLDKMVIVGSDTIKTDLLRKTPVPIRAVYATSPILEPREFPGGSAFLKKFFALHKANPVYGAHYAYDAVYLVADALSRNASVDRQALLNTLKTFDGNCPMTNLMRFGPDGEQRYGAVAVYQLHGGAWEPLMRSDRW